MNSNEPNLQSALDWLTRMVDGCLKVYFGHSEKFEVPALSFYDNEGWLADLLERQKPNYQEFTLLMLALAAHLQPNLLNKLIAGYLPEGGDFPEFGGVKGANHRGLLPTGETAQFILAGDDLGKRLEVQRILGSDHWFAQQKMLWLEPVPEGEPVMSGRLVLDAEVVECLTVGAVSKPRFSMDFPAEYIETQMDWNDLVLHPNTSRQIREIEQWIKHNDTLLFEWGMKKKIKPGYRALFYGPPGTGKTLTATLLGKQTGKAVFRIDLSRVVSKYIGETEKNLSRLFDKAENKDWILFFDEADALFGKRTEIRDAHDKYANQEVAYLLQRIESYNGLVVLASNQRGNIDEAFVRRFQAIVHFPIPGPEERAEIWRKTFPAQIRIHKDLDWDKVASRYELSGANILNITHYCALQCLAGDVLMIDLNRLETAIQRELIKEGKVF
ncbi:MAG: ATP-binding protein [Methylicorpusculum sp.]|uniref:ATP-binding protein n=1 Tax=Methylicorpusculum sp. TaxID=2713644 RepID=UPI00271E0274|nr:ATP-binding protein [Methylicorpusculum sp.]MDO8937587.1 ATP-binding protein [Methylicorpusculum sp.]MDP2203076.1 ATP-binding protein [Methylicorpusculum sp.]